MRPRFVLILAVAFWGAFVTPMLRGRSDAAAAETAAGASAMALDWEVAYGGVTVAKFRFDERREHGHYRLTFDGQTVGVAALMFPATVTASTMGSLVAGLPAPSLYLSQSSGRYARHSRLAYHAGAAPDIEIEPKPGTDAEGPVSPVPADSLIDTVDPLSSLLALAGTVEAADACVGAIRVFDGRRRYDLTIAPPGAKDTVERSGPYRDLPARRCAMHVVPIGGYPIDRTKRMADNDSVFWLAQPPGIDASVPIEIAFSGRWGVLRARLTGPVDPITVVAK